MNYSNSQRAGVILYLTALIFGGYVLLMYGNLLFLLTRLMRGVTIYATNTCVFVEFLLTRLMRGVTQTIEVINSTTV